MLRPRNFPVTTIGQLVLCAALLCAPAVGPIDGGPRAASRPGGSRTAAAGAGAAKIAAGLVPSELDEAGVAVSGFEFSRADKAGWHAVWVRGAGKGKQEIVYARIGADGLAAAPVRVAEPGSTWGDPINPPDVAALSDGTIVVAWRTPGAEEAGSEVLVARSTDGGKIFSSPVKVSDGVTGYRDFESLAILPGDRVGIVWIDGRDASPTDRAREAFDLRSSVSEDKGRTFPPSRVVSRGVCGCCATDMAVLEDGTVTAVWRGVRDRWRDPFAGLGTLPALETKPLPVRTRWALEGCPHTPTGVSTRGSAAFAWWFNGSGDSGKSGDSANSARWETALIGKPAPADRQVARALQAKLDRRGRTGSALRVGFDARGGAGAVWIEKETRGGQTADVLYGLFIDPAAKPAEPVVLARSAGEPIAHPALAPAADGRVLVAWLEGAKGSRHARYVVIDPSVAGK